jgi:hypothetical protein
MLKPPAVHFLLRAARGEAHGHAPPSEPGQGNVGVIELAHERTELGTMVGGFEHNQQVRGSDQEDRHFRPAALVLAAGILLTGGGRA